ncbi:MAG: deoxynucleoside kinase [Phototrophicales bacterium]|nr:MAG: deoxynucleoside kinase [Phototrophicales bacterium]
MVNTKNAQLIAIAGNIGVGKSSLAKRLEEHFGWQCLLESVDENPYLADFYTDMKRWSFHSQIYFLSRRLEQYQQLATAQKPVIQDRTIYEDAEIFAHNLYVQGYMTDQDYKTYQHLYNGVQFLLPPPDVLIYLRASVGVLAERIAQRSRDYERQISIEYLAQLNTRYEEWVSTWQRSPIIYIDCTSLDFVNNKRDFESILQQLPRTLLNT